MQALSDFYFPSTMTWGPTLTPIRARASSLFLTNHPPPPLHQTLDLPFVYMYMCGLPSDYVGILGTIV